MRTSARDAPSIEYAYCPDCGQPRVTAGPFTKSGPLEGRSTVLDVTAHRDERGYTVCTSCALVLDDSPIAFDEGDFDDGLVARAEPGLARTTVSASTYQNHYDRLMRRHTTFDMRRGDLRSRLAVPRKTRDRVTFLSGILYDTDALCSAFQITGSLKDDIIHAVETFFTTVSVSERRSICYEAHVTAIAEAVLKRRAPGRLSPSEGVRLWLTFGVSQTKRDRATERVEAWFLNTYWK